MPPGSATSGLPRWRQILWKARTRPSVPRTISQCRVGALSLIRGVRYPQPLAAIGCSLSVRLSAGDIFSSRNDLGNRAHTRAFRVILR